MTRIDTAVAGAYILDVTPIPDDRGFFAEAFRHDTFERLGLSTRIAQVNISYNDHAHTLRGMHYQRAPHAEVKVVRCVRGAVYDVAVDLRPDSPTFGRWAAVELTADNRRAFYVPEGCAHGYQTLTDNTEVHYLVSTTYAPSHYEGVRWNDPFFNVTWPDAPQRHMHARDLTYPDFRP